MRIFISAVMGAFVWASPASSDACGGFFCNQNQPVNQAAEQIIFSADAGQVTTIVQIQYSGPSEQFAWILPLPAVPDTIEVSSNLAFVRLQNATNPTYRMNTQVEGTCKEPPRQAPGAFGDSSFGIPQDGGLAADAAGGPVTVVRQDTVGPFESVVLQVTNGTAQNLITWLTDNSYDVGGIAPDLLMAYVEQGAVFLALKLTKTAQTGDIRPIRFSYAATVPTIPIRLTAVAVDDDMPVLVWVLGKDHAVPTNYLSLSLNEARIDWFNPNNNYNDVVTEAANEAGGQGFVTELASATGDIAGSVVRDFENTVFARQFANEDWTNREGELLNSAVRNFFQWDGLAGVVRDEVPLPMGLTLQELLRCIPCGYPENLEDIADFDPVTFLEALRTRVVEPMINTRTLIESQPKLTRLYSTMSAAEMTMDPTFDFNPTVSAYSNVHVADRVIECASNIERGEAPWRVQLPGGDVVRGTGNAWPRLDTMGQPANRMVTMQNTTGAGMVITDNTMTIQQSLAAYNATVPGPEGITPGGNNNGGGLGGGTPRTPADGCGCSTREGGTAAGIWAVLFIVVLGIRRRNAH